MLDTRITQKGQATIPLKIRKMLGLEQGDRVQFDITDNGVMIRKAEPLDKPYMSGVEAQLSEWNSQEDNDAYRDL